MTVIPTRTGPLRRFIVAALQLVNECDRICIQHARATAAAYGDRDDTLGYWDARLAEIERKARALEAQ